MGGTLLEHRPRVSKLPTADWLRDFVGILKITFAVLLLVGIDRPRAAGLGGIGIAVLMAGAFLMHLRVKNPPFKMLACLTLLVLSLVIAALNYQILHSA